MKKKKNPRILQSFEKDFTKIKTRIEKATEHNFYCQSHTDGGTNYYLKEEQILLPFDIYLKKTTKTQILLVESINIAEKINY